MNLMEKYWAKHLRNNRRESAGYKAEVLECTRSPQTPQAAIKKAIFIESGYLNDTFYLCANQYQAKRIEEVGGVCYLPKEISILLTKSLRMDVEVLKDYLNKIHATKKAFPGARII